MINPFADRRVDYRFIRPDNRAGRLEENERFAGHFITQFCCMLGVVAPDTDDLLRFHRRQQADLVNVDGIANDLRGVDPWAEWVEIGGTL